MSDKLNFVADIIHNWELPNVQSIRTLQEDGVYKIETSDVSVVCKEEKTWRSSERIEFIGDVLEFLSTTNLKFQLPVILPGKNGFRTVRLEDKFYYLCHFIQGEPHPKRLDQNGLVFYETGRALGELHNAMALYPDHKLRKRTYKQDVPFDLKKYLSEPLDLTAQEASIFKKVQTDYRDELISAVSDLPIQLIHRDCYADNIINDGLSIAGFIDYDNMCISTPLFDLSYYAIDLQWINPVGAGSELWLDQLPRLIEGYCDNRQLSQAEIHAFPHMLVYQHFLYCHYFVDIGQNETAISQFESLLWIYENFERIKQTFI